MTRRHLHFGGSSFNSADEAMAWVVEKLDEPLRGAKGIKIGIEHYDHLDHAACNESGEYWSAGVGGSFDD